MNQTEFKSQFETFKKKNKVKQSIRPLKFESYHKTYLRSALQKNFRTVILICFLIFLQVVFELAILIIGRSLLYHETTLLNQSDLVATLVLLGGVLLTYLGIIYQVLSISRRFVFEFLNELRRKIYANYLASPFYLSEKEIRSQMIARITYHFSLIQMGFTSSITNSIYLAISVITILVLIIFLSPEYIPYFLILALIFAVIAVLGYFATKKYLEGERTMSTKIISHFVESFDNASWIKKEALEYDYDQKLDTFVQFDTYFKVKRNVFMNLSNRALFVLISILIAIFYIWKQYNPDYLSLDVRSVFSISIVIAVISNLAYMSLNAGIYYLPLKLGLIICIPQNNRTIHKQLTTTFNHFLLRCRKARLFTENEYYKKIEIAVEYDGSKTSGLLNHEANTQEDSLESPPSLDQKDMNSLSKSTKMLVEISDYHEAHNLARIISGAGTPYGKPFITKIDGKRVSHIQYCNQYRFAYYIDPEMFTENTIAEILTGVNKANISSEDFHNLITFLSDIPESRFIFSTHKKTATKYSYSDFSIVERGIIQMLGALWQKPPLVVIDRIWTDLQNPEIERLIGAIMDSSSAVILMVDTKKEDQKNPANYGKKITKRLTFDNGKINEN